MSFAIFADAPQYIRARWLWLRALGLIFFSAFYSLLFQIHGLIGPNGLLPARKLLWLDAGDRALDVLVWTGMAASVALVFNVFPRTSTAIAFVCFLAFVMAAQDFSGYQSDGMLLEAALISLFLGRKDAPPPRAAVFMLQWEWFRIYFESGVVKILSGEPQWRNLTAMDKYYENGPLPTWIGWYVQQWPHGFHAFTAALTLVVELLVVWLVFFPKKSRLIAFCIVTPLQIGIILTANYAFLNYLVLALGFLLLETKHPNIPSSQRPNPIAIPVLTILFITTVAGFLFPNFPTVRLLEPYRVANSYGLFAVMTRARYEIEFQGTRDGTTWIAYPFRYKPQDPRARPGIYAPYQPRFEWNLWFAALGSWRDNPWVLTTEARLVENEPSVLQLFAANPFAAAPPTAVRAVQWQYWFTTREERRKTGAWWRREYLGEYAPAIASTLQSPPPPAAPRPTESAAPPR